MTDISIPQGDTEQIAKPVSPGRNYQVRIEDSDVRVSDVRNYAEQGVLIQAGQDALIRSPADTGLFVHSPDGTANVEINQGTKNGLGNDEHPEIRLFPSGQTSISGEIDANIEAWNAGTLPVEQQTPIAVEDSTGTLISPATDGTLSSELSREIGTWNAGTLPVSLGANESGIAHGQTSVTSNGTAEQLNGGSSQSVPDGQAVAITAGSDNTGNIYIGDSTVNDTNGFILGPSAGVTLQTDDVTNIYVDSDDNGDSVSWIVEIA